MELILASNSPRRKELLAQITTQFRIVPSLFGETARGLSACDTVLLFSREKAREVHSRFPEAAVLGADTVVALDGKVLGKPKNATYASKMLHSLSGKTHSVFTGVCLIAGDIEEEFYTETKVTFHTLSDELIEEYIKSVRPFDKAGAYGIQDGFPLVERYEGSYTNIVGLPVEETRSLLLRRNLI